MTTTWIKVLTATAMFFTGLLWALLAEEAKIEGRNVNALVKLAVGAIIVFAMVIIASTS